MKLRDEDNPQCGGAGWFPKEDTGFIRMSDEQLAEWLADLTKTIKQENDQAEES